MPALFVHHRTWQGKRRAIMDKQKLKEDTTDDSSDSDSSSMSATTLPNRGITWWDRSNYRSRRPGFHTKLTSIMDSTTRSRSTTRHSTSWRPSSTTNFHSHAVTAGSSNMTGSRPVSVALTVALAALGGVIVVLLLLIAYFGYFRKRQRSRRAISNADGGIQMVEGLTNIGYSEHNIIGKKGDRLSIIPECTEENEYEYDLVDCDKHSTILVSGGVDEYEYIDPDRRKVKDNMSDISDENESYEYNNPDNQRPGTLPSILVTGEETDYVDPDKTSNRPDSMTVPEEQYQSMIQSTLGQHFYADRNYADHSDYASTYRSQESLENEDEPPEYAVIESPVTEDNEYQDDTTPK